MASKFSPPRPDLVLVANSVATEKNIPADIVFEALEQAIVKAAHGKYGYDIDIAAKIDRKDGSPAVYKRITVVPMGKLDNPDDPEVELEFDPKKMIRVEDADGLAVGEYIDEELLPIDFGRSNFQSVRQIVVSKIRAAEKEKEYAEFAGKEGTIVNGLIKRVEYGSVFVDIQGKAEAVIRRCETIPREPLRVGDRIRAVILEVKRDNSGAQVLLSRSHTLFLAKLFEAEIPEVYEGVVEVKAVARDPGSRAKVAVLSHESSIDPVGAAVGTKGIRIQNIVNELAGERIDVIEYTANVAALAVDALSPAKVSKVIVDEEAKKIDAIVADDQLSLAIGRHGQNVRLASQLLGWGIDVMSEDQSKEKRQRDIKERTAKFITALDIDDVIAHLLVVEGFTSIEDIAMIDITELTSIEGFDEGVAIELQNRAKVYLEALKSKFTDEAKAAGIADDLTTFDALSQEQILMLGAQGVKSLDDLADLAADELVEMLGDGVKASAEGIIMKAREHWFADEPNSMPGAEA